MQHKHLSFPVKMMLGYAIGLLFLMMAFALSTSYTSSIIDDYNNIMRNSWRQLNTLQEIRASSLTARTLIDHNPLGAKNELARTANQLNSFLQSGKYALPGDFIQLNIAFDLFRLQAEKTLGITQDNSPPSRASEQYKKMHQAYSFFIGKLHVQIVKSQNRVELSEVEYIRRANQLLLHGMFLPFAGIAFIYFYGSSLSSATGARIRKTTSGLQKVLAGNYQERITDNSHDEIGQISRGINDLAQKLSEK